MKENVTIKEYMKLNGYKIADANFDITNLDPECLFVGDVYVVKYKGKYDIRASFEEQTTLKLKVKDAILLRVGFDRYVNLTNVKTKKIEKETTISRNKNVILGSFFKPYVGDQVVLNVRLYQEQIQHERPKVKKITKHFK